MRTINIGADRVAYDPATDVLFASLGDYDPTMLDEELDAGNGVYLQYAWPSKALAFIEVFGFARRFGKLPTTICIDSPEAMRINLPRELVSA